MKVAICNDYYNAVYTDGKLTTQGSPEVVNVETVARLDPTAEIYVVPQDVYDDVLDGAGYPADLSAFPLNRCQKVR